LSKEDNFLLKGDNIDIIQFMEKLRPVAKDYFEKLGNSSWIQYPEN